MFCLLEGYIPMNIYALGLAILRVCELFGMVGEFHVTLSMANRDLQRSGIKKVSLNHLVHVFRSRIHSLKFNIAPENGWLEYHRFPLGQKASFQGRTVMLVSGSVDWAHWSHPWTFPSVKKALNIRCLGALSFLFPTARLWESPRELQVNLGPGFPNLK